MTDSVSVQVLGTFGFPSLLHEAGLKELKGTDRLRANLDAAREKVLAATSALGLKTELPLKHARIKTRIDTIIRVVESQLVGPTFHQTVYELVCRLLNFRIHLPEVKWGTQIEPRDVIKQLNAGCKMYIDGLKQFMRYKGAVDKELLESDTSSSTMEFHEAVINALLHVGGVGAFNCEVLQAAHDLSIHTIEFAPTDDLELEWLLAAKAKCQPELVTALESLLELARKALAALWHYTECEFKLRNTLPSPMDTS
ncbi:Hypothetical protein POVN_LOCUS654 [uncultured virus]|nr:Hypothetical protein POVN_LOCUS654 [uncultured virus]